MKHEIAEKLEATIHRVEPRLREMTDADASKPLKEGGWSLKEVLGHLIDSASNNHQRFVRLQQFEHIKLPAYDQEHWVATQGYHDASWTLLVDLWSSYNRHLAGVIRRIRPAALQNRCELAFGREVTLDFFVDDYLGHLEHHLRQMGISDELTVPYPLEKSPNFTV